MCSLPRYLVYMRNFIRQAKRTAGFTLVEMSIVLVIVSLIITTVLVGVDMIKTAQIRSVITDVRALATATNIFQAKYNCMPGDCPIATTYFPAAINGDGDGMIDSVWWQGGGLAACTIPPNYSTSAEPFQYYYQLAQAGLIRGSYTGVHGTNTSADLGYRNFVPGSNIMSPGFNATIGYTVVMWPACSNAGVDYSTPIMANYNSNVIMIGAVQPDWGGSCCETYAPAFTPTDAYYLDSKIDDGLPGQGNVVLIWPGLWTAAPYNAPACTTSLVAATAQYNLSITGIACSFFIANQF